MKSNKRPGRPAKPMPEPIPDTPENTRDILMRTPTRTIKRGFAPKEYR